MSKANRNPGPIHQGIIILGTPRSGTTLLRRILNAHPNITCPGETNLLTGCARFLRSEKIAEDVEIGVLAGLEYAGFERAAVLERLREFAFGFHRENARTKGKARWAEKTAFDSFYVDEIEALCGDHAHFICVIRNGLDFVVSMQDLSIKNQTYLNEVHNYIKQHSKPLVAFAHCWRHLTRRILKFVQAHPKNSVLLKYEDLISAPLSAMERILKAVGEDLPDDLIENAMRNKVDVGLGDWRTYSFNCIDKKNINRASALSARTKSELGKIMNDLLSECGYETADTILKEDTEKTRRRYELGLLLSSMKKS